jgi:hypothetical protein
MTLDDGRMEGWKDGRRMLDGRKSAIGLYYYYVHLRPKDHR